MKKGLKTGLLVAFSVFCLGSAATGVYSYENAAAATSFQMVDGAAIRVHGNVDTYGIRFSATHTEYNKETNYQMMVLPTEYVEQYEADTTENKENIVAWMLDKKASYEQTNVGETFPLAIVNECLYDEEKGYIYGSIVDVQYQNLNRDFCAYVYYQNGSEYVVAGETSSEEEKYRSIAEVAISALESGDYDGQNKETEKANLESIVANAIKQSQGLNQEDEVSITLNATSLTELRGKTAQLTYEGIGAELIEYASNDENVCTVDENGLVTFKNIGETKITATVCGVETTVDVVSTVPANEVLSFDCESDIKNINAMGGTATTEYLSEFEGEQGVAKLTYTSGWPFVHFQPLQKMANYADYDVIIFRMYFPQTSAGQYIRYWKLGNNNGGTNIFASNINGNFLGEHLNTWINLVFDADTFTSLWNDNIDLNTTSGSSPRIWGESTGGASGEYYISDISLQKYSDNEVLSFDHRVDLDKITVPTASNHSAVWLDSFKGETGVVKIEYPSNPQFTFLPNLNISAYDNATQIVFRVYVSDEGSCPMKAPVLGSNSIELNGRYNQWVNLEYDISNWINRTSAQNFWAYSLTTGLTGNSCFYIAGIWVE